MIIFSKQKWQIKQDRWLPQTNHTSAFMSQDIWPTRSMIYILEYIMSLNEMLRLGHQRGGPDINFPLSLT